MVNICVTYHFKALVCDPEGEDLNRRSKVKQQEVQTKVARGGAFILGTTHPKSLKNYPNPFQNYPKPNHETVRKNTKQALA